MDGEHEEKKKNAVMDLSGKLDGHNGAITQLAVHPMNPNVLISSSRDKSLLIWHLEDLPPYGKTGHPVKSLLGHGHFVSDVTFSSDGKYALSGSCDRTLRLWNLETGQLERKFISHTVDVLSVAMSPDNRAVCSASRDKTIKVWNTLGQCKVTLSEREEGHNHWVTAVRFAQPSHGRVTIVSAGYDKVVKTWDMSTCRLTHNHIGHRGYINSVAISPDQALVASAGKDGSMNLWDLEKSEHIWTLKDSDPIAAVSYSPSRYWICSTVKTAVKIWDLDTKAAIEALKVVKVSETDKSGPPPLCTAMAWSADGDTLYAGYSDGSIRVWAITQDYKEKEAAMPANY